MSPAGRAHKEEKKEAVDDTESAQVRQAKPEDLGYVGVQKKGLAMSAAKTIEARKKEMEKALKEVE